MFFILTSLLTLYPNIIYIFLYETPGTAELVTQHVYLGSGCESTQTRTAAINLLAEIAKGHLSYSAQHAQHLAAIFVDGAAFGLTNL